MLGIAGEPKDIVSQKPQKEQRAEPTQYQEQGCPILKKAVDGITGKYSGQFYNQKQIENLIRVVKGDPIEFGVITASFYGLRRSEVLGLKWDAIDFENKTITIRHTVHEVTVDSKTKIVASDTTKTKSSYRSLPLVKPFEEILLKMKREQEENKRLCGRCYCQNWPLRKFCVSDIRQNQEYHVNNVNDGGLFPLSSAFPGGWDGMRAERRECRPTSRES